MNTISEEEIKTIFNNEVATELKVDGFCPVRLNSKIIPVLDDWERETVENSYERSGLHAAYTTWCAGLVLNGLIII